MKTIPVGNNGDVALVDDDIHHLLEEFTWHLTCYGYAATGTRIFMHQLILGIKKGQMCDHIDRNKINNQVHNLRFVIGAQNKRNAIKYMRGDGTQMTSKYKGVSWSRTHNKWRAQIVVQGKATYLGLFLNEEEAARAYDNAARRIDSEHYHTNGA